MNLSGAFPGVSNPSYLRFNVFSARISGYVYGVGHQIAFYDTETSTYNNLYAANYYTSSDARAKTNIVPINYGLATINKLRPVSYNLIKDPTGKNDHRDLGFIAQEIEQVLPELVKTDEEGRKLVNYSGLIPVLIKAVQELQKEVAELKAAK